MHYVIIRDDDTNAFTPVECLERLYRPFLDAGLPVNLAVIPDVAVDASRADGQRECFLRINGDAAKGPSAPGFTPAAEGVAVLARTRTCEQGTRSTRPMRENQPLVRYLLENPGYHIAQHGCHHDYCEFDRRGRAELVARFEHGRRELLEAGFPPPNTFIAPHDKMSRAGLIEVTRRFRVFSTGWFEWKRLPVSWWPRYLFKKFQHAPHWRVGRTLLLTHPGCLLSYQRAFSTMMGGIFHYLNAQRVTVLVTHWWEYFRNNEPDEEFISFLHETASYLASHPKLKVITFDDLIRNGIPLA